MTKYKDYLMDYQQALSRRTLSQVRRAEEIKQRVDRTKAQDQRMMAIINSKNKVVSDELIFLKKLSNKAAEAISTLDTLIVSN